VARLPQPSLRRRVAFHNASARANGFRRISEELYRTHTFAPNTSGIDTGDSFGSDAQRTRPITFEFGITRGGAAPTGDVLSLGTPGVRALVISLSDDDLVITAGATGADQATKTVQDILPVEGERFTIGVCLYPNRGRVTVWHDGKLFDSFASASGDFDGAWASDDPNGTYGVALVDATVGPLFVFNNQFPFRQRI
jgi:hypothetical protein